MTNRLDPPPPLRQALTVDAGVAAAVGAERALALLTAEVRVDYLGTDVTYKRDTGALRKLRGVTFSALKGSPSPSLPVVTSAFGPAPHRDDVMGVPDAAPPLVAYDAKLDQWQLEAVDAALGPIALSVTQVALRLQPGSWLTIPPCGAGGYRVQAPHNPNPNPNRRGRRARARPL